VPASNREMLVRVGNDKRCNSVEDSFGAVLKHDLGCFKGCATNQRAYSDKARTFADSIIKYIIQTMPSADCSIRTRSNERRNHPIEYENIL